MSILDTTTLSNEPADAVKSSTSKSKKTTAKRKSTTTTSKKTTSRSTTTRRKSTTRKYTKTGIPGLSVRFSWKEFLGITKLRRMFTKKTGIPTTQAGIERKIGNKIVGWMKEKVGWKE